MNKNLRRREGKMPTRSNIAREPRLHAGKITSDFDERQFLSCLLTEANGCRAIGEVLQDPGILAGIERPKRVEILSACRIDPCNPVEDLTASKLERLCRSVTRILDAKSRPYKTT
jgi:formamidopyrimidine-DNA glycosylase